jgi:proline iminopeptidase
MRSFSPNPQPTPSGFLVYNKPMSLIPVRDISLFTRVIGQGNPLVLMHGGPGVDHSLFYPLFPLAQNHTLILYDHRCNGRSLGPDVSTMTWDNLTADADALRQSLGFEKWAVLGHSFGGMVALEYALRFPDRLTHLILVDTCADTWWVQQNAPELLAKRGYSHHAVDAAHRVFNGHTHRMKWDVLRFGRAYTYKLNLVELIHLLRAKTNPAATIFGFGQLMPGWTVMDRLHEIQTPTLIIAGRHDFEFPPEHQAIMADRLPHARLEIIERAGHNSPQERPVEVRAAIERFLSSSS